MKLPIPFTSRSRQALVLLIALVAVLATALAACTAPPPAPTPDIPATVTAQVQTHLDSVPTVTPLPTYTPYPTATPYPTPTAAPTATAYPTATPRPTYTPYPTATPTPTAIPTRTPSPTVTPTATPRLAPTATLAPTLVEYSDTDGSYTIKVPRDWDREIEFFEDYEKGMRVSFSGPDGVVGISIFAIYSEWGWIDDSDSYINGVFENMEENLIEGTLEIRKKRPSQNGGVYVSSSYQRVGACPVDSVFESLVLRKWLFLVEVYACQRQFSQFEDLLLDSINSFTPTAYGRR